MVLTPEERQKINPGLSAALSFLVNGLGQIYNGQIKKGLMLIAMSTVLIFLTLVGAILVLHWLFAHVFGPAELILGLILMVVGVVLLAALGGYNIYDAYNVARKKLTE